MQNSKFATVKKMLFENLQILHDNKHERRKFFIVTVITSVSHASSSLTLSKKFSDGSCI